MLFQEFCNIDGVTNMGQSALHLAVHQGHARIVERLVGFGINLNLQDSDGDTALHIALSRDTAKTLSAETHQLKKVSHCS
jgi:ankyrin repeat protein